MSFSVEFWDLKNKIPQPHPVTVDCHLTQLVVYWTEVQDAMLKVKHVHQQSSLPAFFPQPPRLSLLFISCSSSHCFWHVWYFFLLFFPLFSSLWRLPLLARHSDDLQSSI